MDNLAPSVIRCKMFSLNVKSQLVSFNTRSEIFKPPIGKSGYDLSGKAVERVALTALVLDNANPGLDRRLTFVPFTDRCEIGRTTRNFDDCQLKPCFAVLRRVLPIIIISYIPLVPHYLF